MFALVAFSCVVALVLPLAVHRSRPGLSARANLKVTFFQCARLLFVFYFGSAFVLGALSELIPWLGQHREQLVTSIVPLGMFAFLFAVLGFLARLACLTYRGLPPEEDLGIRRR